MIYKNRHELSRFKSGGIAIAIKKDVSFKWKKGKNTYDTMLSIKIEGRSVLLGKDVLVTAVYIPPSHSRYAKLDHYDQVENMLLNHVNDYHLLCGDFNAHTGPMRDSILVNDNDGIEFVGINNDNFTDLNALGFSVETYNQDATGDRSSYGRKLVELCKNNDVYIFNGRLGKLSSGENRF